MIVWLDFAIFGSGRGMAMPYHDGQLFWLVDTTGTRGQDAEGELYTHMSGYGAQLHSYQWTHPLAGEERRLAGRRFRPLHSRRRWGRVEIAWSACDMPRDLGEANAWLRQFKHDLCYELNN